MTRNREDRRFVELTVTTHNEEDRVACERVLLEWARVHPHCHVLSGHPARELNPAQRAFRRGATHAVLFLAGFATAWVLS